ncbi:MAG TPA: glucuronate isomerase [Caulobacteraceae bacterium]|jgi:glucuronate isomerase|nr:glucuronate isomerase [Caulobacteraceae bacterium]
MPPLRLDQDRLFPAEPGVRAIARRLFARVENLPIVSPHGHCDPEWFASDAPFTNAASLLVTPDHYVTRMVHSGGVPLESLGVPRTDDGWTESDPRLVWRRFAQNYHLFRGTPSRLWLDWVFAQLFGLRTRLGPDTADIYFDAIAEALRQPAFRPRALFETFSIEVLATTDSPLDPLSAHGRIRESGWSGRIVPTFRPDALIDPEHPAFRDNLHALAELTGEAAETYRGYLRALEMRREHFRAMGATATDHGHRTALTLDLSPARAEALFHAVAHGAFSPAEAERFRGHMLMQMGRMSADDGMTLQIHPGVARNHDPRTLARFGADRGADIPVQAEFTSALQPLLNRFGHSSDFTIVVFTVDETTYARELAPLAGFYPALKLGAPWWFNDSPEGMRRFREQASETAGFYNTVGFTDDTRAFLSIPARHDAARRIDCAWLARLAAEGRLDEDEAQEVARALAYDLPKAAYRL